MILKIQRNIKHKKVKVFPSVLTLDRRRVFCAIDVIVNSDGCCGSRKKTVGKAGSSGDFFDFYSLAFVNIKAHS